MLIRLARRGILVGAAMVGGIAVLRNCMLPGLSSTLCRYRS